MAVNVFAICIHMAAIFQNTLGNYLDRVLCEDDRIYQNVNCQNQI